MNDQDKERALAQLAEMNQIVNASNHWTPSPYGFWGLAVFWLTAAALGASKGLLFDHLGSYALLIELPALFLAFIIQMRFIKKEKQFAAGKQGAHPILVRITHAYAYMVAPAALLAIALIYCGVETRFIPAIGCALTGIGGIPLAIAGKSRALFMFFLGAFTFGLTMLVLLKNGYVLDASTWLSLGLGAGALLIAVGSIIDKKRGR